ncbi:phage major capsid protein [Lactococcus hodotermopsidis]|uniref:Phage major capsid protein n=1 Tax=Pseudolactococcus hodotermopsidis TaxID=2709157 RepID=A0A6A0BDG5_9LACT|nr:phage major capsid protein [Lactococcus hodotermopsidis]GFH42733.1 phage major capsid protein [Lactococcus hodotermopsidis]
MTIFNKLPNYQAAVTKFTESVANDADKTAQNELYAEAMQTLGSDLTETLTNSSRETIEQMFDAQKLSKGMTASEVKFFNDISKNVGTKNPILLPEESINEVFEDLKTEHPILSVINFKNAGLRLKALVAETSGAAGWDDVFTDIKNQLDTVFSEEDFSQSKLTAFVVVPKDALKFEPFWLKQFILGQITEAFSVALESAIVNGDGNKKPIGLTRDLNSGTTSGGVTIFNPKTSTIDLTGLTPENAPSLLKNAMSVLSMSEKGKSVAIAGSVIMLVNPSDYYELEAKFTSLNSNGVYTFTLPFGIKVMQSVAVSAGKVVIFVAKRYNAYVGGGTEIKEYEQTLAVDDLNLYTAKAFYFGKPKDNNVAVIGTLVSEGA